MNYKVTLPELGRTIEAPAGRTLLEVLRAAGCAPEAPSFTSVGRTLGAASRPARRSSRARCAASSGSRAADG